MTENIFSEFVLGLTLPKPTDVKLLNVKYIAVIYLSLIMVLQADQLLSLSLEVNFDQGPEP